MSLNVIHCQSRHSQKLKKQNSKTLSSLGRPPAICLLSALTAVIQARGGATRLRHPVAPPLLTSRDALLNRVSLNKATLHTLITLFPKEDMDGSDCVNECSISLLKVDLKIFTKVLANCLLSFIPLLVHNDPVQFIQNREARYDTYRV